MIKKIFYIAFMFLTISGCKTEDLSVSDYKTWIGDKNNGLYKNNDVDEFKFSCMYRPVDWLSLREIERSKLSISKFDSVKDKFNGLQYYALKIVNNNIPELIAYKAADNQAYQSNFTYYSGDMKNDIYMIENNDTIPCVLFHYERNYGAAPVNIFDIAFENRRADIISDKQIIVNAGRMGAGIIKFKFNKEDIKDIPKLKFN